MTGAEAPRAWHRVLTDALDQHAKERPNALALQDTRRAISFEELALESSRIAASLHQGGVEPGDHVAVLLENRIELAAAVYACWRIGAVAAILGVGPEGLVGPSIALCPARAIVCSRLSRDIASSANVELFLDVDGPDDDSASWRTYRQRSPSSAHAQLGLPEREADAVVLFTSGSTATPKGIRLSHEAICRNAELTRHYLSLDGSCDRTSLFLPLSTRMALSALLAHLLAGAPASLDVGLFGERGFALTSIAALTGFSAAPSHLRTLMDRGLLKAGLLPALRYVRVGAGPLDRKTALRLLEARPEVEVIGTYGMSECGEITFLSGKTMGEGEPDSVGHAFADVDLRILDPEGRSAAAGELGEIVVSGPRLLTGYLGQDPHDPGVPFRTGDRGALDAGGAVRFLGRQKDLIKVGGLSVELNGLADRLSRVEGVKEVVAIGVPDPFLGEAAYVFAVPHEDCTLDRKALLDAARSVLPPAALPKGVHIVTELPRLASGKIDRRTLAEMILRKEQR